jgi:hypothetical protein
MSWVLPKDAGFVYKSLQNDTNRVFWDFWPYESNPQYESFEKRYTKRIHNTNLMKPGLRNESTIRIFWMPYGFANPKYGIRMDSNLFKVRLCTKIGEDSWGFVGLVKTGLIFWKLAGFVCTIRYESFHVRIREPRYDTNRTFLKSGFVLTIRYESMDSRNESMFLRISYTIPASLVLPPSNTFLLKCYVL